MKKGKLQLKSLLTVSLLIFETIPLIAFKSDILPLRPIPISPPSIEKPSKEKTTQEINNKRTEYSKKYTHSDGYFINTYFPRSIHKRGRNGGWEDIEENSNANNILRFSTPTPLSLCLYAAGASFDQNGTKSLNELNLYHYTSGEVTLKSDAYLRYPHLRDLIPSTGTLSQVSIVIPEEVPNSSPFTVAAYAVLDSWNPATVTGANLPEVAILSSGQNQLDLNPNTLRSQRSIDITSLVQAWFEGTQSDFGVCLSIPSPSQTQNGVTGIDLPLLIVKYTVPETPSDPAFGGSYYSDNMTPPVLIPGRAVLVDRVGDLDNSIQSFVFSKYDMSTMIPYGEDTATVVMNFPDTFISSSTIPIAKPKPYSNACFQTYTFPPLTGDPGDNSDIYENYALTATLPDNDPTPVGLLPSPPHLSDSYQFINLGNDPYRDSFIDITSLVNTPVSGSLYPNYPLQQFTSVVKANHDLITSQNPVQLPLSSLPMVITISGSDIGSDGELENRRDLKVINSPISIAPVLVNPILGHLSVIPKGINGSQGNIGCLGIQFQWEACFGIDMTSCYIYQFCEKITFELINIPGQPAQKVKDKITYIGPNGSIFMFTPVKDEEGELIPIFYNEKVTNMRIIKHDENPSSLRYELTTQNGGISRWFDADGRLTQITSVEGGLIRYNRDQNDPDKVLSMEDVFSGLKYEMTYDTSGRLTEVKDPMNLQLQFQYDANNRVERWIDPMSRSVWFEYNAQNQVISTSFTSPTQITPKTLFSFSYGLPPSSIGPLTLNQMRLEEQNTVTTITDPCGLVTEVTVNKTAHQTSVVNPSGSTLTYSYYHDGTLMSATDGSTLEEYIPDSEQASSASVKVEKCEDPENPTPVKTLTIEYDDERRVIEVTDLDENTTSYAYDTQNRLVSITDSEEKETTITYNEEGLIESKTTESGKSITYVYDEDKQVVSKTLTFKTNQPVTYSYTHDSNGYIDSITDPLERVTEVTFDDLGRLVQSIDPLGKSKQYTYDYDSNVTILQVSKDVTERNVQMRYNDIGQLIAVEDETGHITSYIYDECGRLQMITNPLNQSTQFEYDTSGNLKKVIDAKNHATEYTYDIHGRMTSVKDPAGKITSYQYNTEGKLYRVTDPLQHSVQYEYDILGRITKIKDPLNHETTYTYSPLGKVLTVTDANQHTYTMEYNDDDHLTKVTNPLNQSTQYEYYPFGAVKKIINPNNQFVTYDYDEAFRMISTTDIQNRTTAYEYDDADRVISVTDSANRTTSYEYDLFNNVIEVTNPLDQTTQFEYDECNNQTTVISPMNERYTFAYDALHRKISSTDPLNHTRYYTFDVVGNLSTFEDPLEHVSTFQHDVRDLLDKTTDALEQDALYTYDDACRLNQLTDELQRVTSFQLDADSRMTSVTSPLSRTVSLTYDAIGNLLTVTRPATTGNNPTNAPVDEFSYDSLDRLHTVTDPLDNEISYTYNVLSQITQISLPDSKSVSYTYDNYNRLSAITASDTHEIEYTYDTLDRTTEISYSITGDFTYQYDTLDRITQTTDPNNLTSTLQYDADSRLTQSTWNNQTSTYTYDAASRMTSYTAPGSRSYTNTFDAADRLVTTSLPSMVDVNWQYDAIYRPTNLIYSKPDEGLLSRKIPLNLSNFNRINLEYTLNKGKIAVLREKHGENSEIVWAACVDTSNQYMKQLLDPITIASFSYSYNAVSRVTQVNQSINQVNKTYTYSRDNEDQITSVTTPDATYTYSFDERNNRLSQRIVTISSDITDTYVYNVADQLVSREKRQTANQQLIESFTFEYDNAGQLTEQTKTSVTPNEITEYQYYVGGNLKKVILPDETEISFQYDAMGNRVKKTTDDEIISYQYAMGSLRKEIHQDKTTEAVLYYLLYCPWGFEKVIPASGENPAVVTPYYYIFDQAGLVKAITDDEGTILESYEYSPYGELLTTPTISQYRFVSGREECIWDPETQLYYMHARYYDAVTGRFLSKDSVRGSLTAPISLNRYTYCQNDPVSLADPSGNSPFNTGLPGRELDPVDQDLNIGDSCIPELASSDLGLIPNPIKHQNDQCYLVYTNQSMELYKSITLPNGATVKIILGYGYIDDKGIFVYNIQYIADDLPIIVVTDSSSNSELTKYFIKGIREGIKALYNSQLSGAFGVLDALSNANEFISSGYFDTFKDISFGNNMEDATAFMKHAIIGGYIASKMQKYSDDKYNQYDNIIGFWTSFWMERSGIQMDIMPNYSGKPEESEESCLVDLANIVKAMILQECHFGYGEGDINKPDKDGMIGLMQVYMDSSGWDFVTSDYAKYGRGLNFYEYINQKGHESENKKALNPFNNIGIGVGHLYAKLTGSEKTYNYSTGERGAPTLKQWLDAAGHYNGSGVSGSYRQNVANIIFKGVDSRQGCKNPMTPEYILEYYLNR